MNRKHVRHVMVLTSLWLLACSVWAESDDEELQALMALLEQETDLVTHTRMNADYVPGMITVLYGDDVRQSGLTKVADALSEVAGIFVITSNSGDLRAIVRGLGATQNATNLKLLIDGVAVNRAVDGSADWILRMPLEQVDRIEVIRGPGSAIHGGFAFAGVVNVVPREGSMAGLRLGSKKAGGGHLLTRYRWQSGVSAHINFSHWHRGNSGTTTGADIFDPRVSNAPGTVYDHEQGQIFLGSLRYGDHQLDVHYAGTERGPGHGRSGALTAELQPREETFASVRWQSGWTLADGLRLSGELLHQQTDVSEADFIPLPIGVTPPNGTRPASENTFLRYGSQDSNTQMNLGLHWHVGDNHRLYGEVNYAYLRVDDAYNARTVEGAAPVYGRTESNRVLPGSDRYVSSLTIQDQWQLASDLELTMGIRHDSYSDHVAHTSPRLAMVWRPGEHHLIKAQYAEAFRPPTLAEANPGPDSPAQGSGTLNEETLTSSELAYIYRVADQRIRLTFFDSKVSDQIEYALIPGNQPVWRNRSEIESQGVELEWQQRIARYWQWSFNATWIEARDYLDEDQELLGAATLVGNMSLIWTPEGSLRHSLSLHGVGEREGVEPEAASTPGTDDGNNSPFEYSDRYPAYLLLDYAVHWKNVMNVSNLDLTLVCQNITNQSYRTQSFPSHFPQGLEYGSRIFQASMALGF